MIKRRLFKGIAVLAITLLAGSNVFGLAVKPGGEETAKEMNTMASFESVMGTQEANTGVFSDFSETKEIAAKEIAALAEKIEVNDESQARAAAVVTALVAAQDKADGSVKSSIKATEIKLREKFNIQQTSASKLSGVPTVEGEQFVDITPDWNNPIQCSLLSEKTEGLLVDINKEVVKENADVTVYVTAENTKMSYIAMNEGANIAIHGKFIAFLEDQVAAGKITKQDAVAITMNLLKEEVFEAVKGMNEKLTKDGKLNEARVKDEAISQKYAIFGFTPTQLDMFKTVFEAYYEAINFDTVYTVFDKAKQDDIKKMLDFYSTYATYYKAQVGADGVIQPQYTIADDVASIDLTDTVDTKAMSILTTGYSA